MKDQELPPQYIITNFSRTSFTKQPLQDVYFNNHIQKYNQFHRDLSVIKPQRDIYFVEARNLLKYSINLFGSISWKIPEIQQSKLHVLEVKSEEDIYLKEPHRYLQAYRANTAYQVKKVLEYKQDDSQFKQKLIENVRKVEQQFKEQYSKEAQSSLKDKQLKIYLQNCHENTFFQCLQRFKVCQTKSYKMETKKEVTGATKTLDLQQQEKSNQQNQNE